MGAARVPPPSLAARAPAGAHAQGTTCRYDVSLAATGTELTSVILLGRRASRRLRLPGDEIEQDRIHIISALIGLAGIDNIMAQVIVAREGIRLHRCAMRSPVVRKALLRRFGYKAQ